MPPKKKKTVNMVVGTVSTRSTRRQSVVKFDIPKPNKLSKVTSPTKDEKTFTNPQEKNKLVENIKKTFDKMTSSIEKNVQELDTYSEPVDRDNKQLLEILQDWDDEEDDDQVKNDKSNIVTSEKEKSNIEIEVNKCKESTELSENKQMELMLSEGLEDDNSMNDITEKIKSPQIIEETSVDTSVKDSILDEPSENIQFETLKDENSVIIDDGVIIQNEPEEVIIEEHASIPFGEDLIIDTNTEDSIMNDQENIMIENQEEKETDVPDFKEEIQLTEKISDDTQDKIDTYIASNEQIQNMDCTPIEEEASNEVNYEEKPSLIEEKEIIQDSLENLNQEMPLLTEEVEKMDYEIESIPISAEIIIKENIELKEEPKENKEKIFEALEDKVAEMNLTDEKPEEKNLIEENVKEVQIEENAKEVQIEEKVKEAEIEENIEIGNKKKISAPKKTKKTERKVKQTVPKEEKKTKPNVSKEIVKPNKPIKEAAKAKEKKRPEKPKKVVNEKSNKKNKEVASKETDKADKKSDKKLTKFEEALQSLAKLDKEGEEIRRSSRIKSITNSSKKTCGWGIVKSKSETSLIEGEVSDNNSIPTDSEKSTPTASPKVANKDRKSKINISQIEAQPQAIVKPENTVLTSFKEECKDRAKDPIVEARLKQFVHLKENLYKTDRMVCKEAKKMVCDCFLTQEDLGNNEYGCGDDCLNRLLLIECGNLCVVGDRCTNKRFQKNNFAPVEVFNTEKKGLGLRAAANIPFGEFILEYVGEVLSIDEFDKRAEVYSQDKNIHYYFMALRADAVIDATMKGNISRFINHSCDPNAETQKWTVNGELRIGFFSTRTILAGEEITFDYRFQRYGKEAQKCYCGASICRGWLGEQPDSDEEEDEEEEDETEESKSGVSVPSIKDGITGTELGEGIKNDVKAEVSGDIAEKTDSTSGQPIVSTPIKPTIKRKVQKKKPRIEMFEEVDLLNDEIEMLVTTGLKNQAHTLKLSRLMVRAKEPHLRAKLLRVLRRGELPCRRLFLDYHGLKLMHGYMIDAQQLVVNNKKFESLRLEMLQTLAVLPIPNKTMLQDSKVISTVEKWASSKDLTTLEDSESNSPKDEDSTPKPVTITVESKDENISEKSIEDQEEEIRFLANKLLESWNNLKEVFRIPKKERIEQMKEHEREANKKYMQTNQNTYGSEEYKRMDRYRGLTKGKFERDRSNKPSKLGDKPSAEFLRLSKFERRKLFALQHELKEEERKHKQREMWRQHEMNCLMIGADPRFTAPFDPSRGYQYIWNQQIGQWQTLPIQSNPRLYGTQCMNIPPHLPKPPMAGYQYPSHVNMMNQPAPALQIPPIHQNSIPGHIPNYAPSNVPLYHGQTQVPLQTPPLSQITPTQQIEEDPSQVKFMGPIPPPAKLPPKWKCAKDKYGRPYYYHIKIRKSQWEPPPLPVESEVSDSESSSESSTVSSDSSSENSDSDDDIDDTRLLLEVRKQMDNLPHKAKLLSVDPESMEDTPIKTPSPDEKSFDTELSVDDLKEKSLDEDILNRPSIDVRLKELDLFKDDKPTKKKRRLGLCEEIIISPRTEEDKKQFKEDLKRYKANKEKLKRQKEKIILQTKKQLKEIEMKKAKEKRLKTTVKVKLKEKLDFNSDLAKKIKETFRTNMASTVVSSLNAFRKPDCTEGRITNTQDFKHLARKLTHFVMLKEMKHIKKIEDLTCTDNVKMKAREFIKKYMCKFGEVYVKRSDSPDFKD